MFSPQHLGRNKKCDLEEVCHWEWALTFQKPMAFPVSFLPNEWMVNQM